MRTTHVSWVLVAVLGMTGCGATSNAVAPVAAEPAGGSAPSYAIEPVTASAPPAPASKSSYAPSMADAPPPPPPPASVAGRSMIEPAPSERPGLGTQWGEARFSQVHDVDFERADFTRPFAVATLHYNDRRGVEALAAYHGGHVPRFREQVEAGGAIAVSVRGESNEPLEAVQLADRTFIIGEQGERYSILIANRSNHRIEAVTTVDGVDVMNGQTGSVENRGYVLDPYQTMVVDGFRRSQTNVAAFRFSKVGDSYAAQTGSARNVGVIGIAFFDERGDNYVRWTPNELHMRDTANPFPEGNDRYAKPPPGRW